MGGGGGEAKYKKNIREIKKKIRKNIHAMALKKFVQGIW